MRAYLADNIQFLTMLLVWFMVGAFSPIAGMGVVGISMILLYRNTRYAELFIGFFFILILSDNLEARTLFAKNTKNICILLMAYFIFISKGEFKLRSAMVNYFIPFFIMALIGLLYSPNIGTAIQKTLSYFLMLIVVPGYVAHIYQHKGMAFFKDLLYFMLLIVVIGYLLRFYSIDTAISHGGRLRGIFGNPNGLGVFLILFFCLFTVVTHFQPTLFSRAERFIFYAIIVFCVFRTGSRTSLLAIVFCTVFIRVYKLSPALGFITFLVALFSTELLLNNYQAILGFLGLETVFRVDTLEEGSGRLVAWAFAWENIKESIFVGRGFSYDEHLMRANLGELSKLGHEGGVHNTYLIIWLNTGLIGLLFFLRAFILQFIMAAKKTPLAIPIMFTVFFSINFEPWLAASLNPFTILVLIILTLMVNYETVPQPQPHSMKVPA